MGQKYKKIATLIILTQVSLYNYGSLNEEQESLKQQSNKHIFPGKTIIATFKIPETNTQDVFLFGEDTAMSHVKSRIEKMVITAENNNKEIEITNLGKRNNTYNFHNAGIYIIYYHIKEQEDLSHMFDACENLISLDLSNLDCSNVIYINHLCCNCTNLKKINFNKDIQSNKVQDMSYMFYNCEKIISINLSSFYTSNCKDMSCMFYGCKSLSNLNISNFDTKTCEMMNYMFYNCETLTSLDLSNFYTNNCESVSHMFCGCKSLLRLNIQNFDFSTIINKENFIEGCSSLTEITIKNTKEKSELQQQNNPHANFKIDKPQICCIV